MNHSQVQSIHTGVLSILVNFKMGVLVKNKTLQEPVFIQVDLNWGIKDGSILKNIMKQMIKRKTQIHNFGFLISPTTHLFPLSGQSGSHGVSSMITFELKIWNNEKYYKIIQSCMSILK